MTSTTFPLGPAEEQIIDESRKTDLMASVFDIADVLVKHVVRKHGGLMRR